MLFRLSIVLALLGTLSTNLARGAQDNGFRPPAVPLVTCDPYFSIWSFADRLTSDTTRHWTGAKQSLTSMVRVDGKTYRVMGDEPEAVPELNQVGVTVWPTRTVYDFEGAGVHVTLTFMTPMLPRDLDLLSRPATYLTWQIHSADGKPHDISIYFDASAELAVNTPEEAVVWRHEEVPGLKVMRIGARDRQQVLDRRGDDLRIDWGYAYVAVPELRQHLGKPQRVPRALHPHQGGLFQTFVESPGFPIFVLEPPFHHLSRLRVQHRNMLAARQVVAGPEAVSGIRILPGSRAFARSSFALFGVARLSFPFDDRENPGPLRP